MVQVRKDLPLQKDGHVDIKQWLAKFNQDLAESEQKILCNLSDYLTKEPSIATKQQELQKSIVVAEILLALGIDIRTICTALVYEFEYYNIVEKDIHSLLSVAENELITEIKKLDKFVGATQVTQSQQQGTLYNLRKMLLACVEDARVILIKLAHHLALMIEATTATDEVKIQLANMARKLYIPIANNLGIGQIKWELEDFSFRFLEPEIYKNIARMLDEKRTVREEYIERVKNELHIALDKQGIEAKLYGRAKHIYSIWRKMQRKQVDYKEIYDIQAIRIIVKDETSCYGALGVVHALWQHIPKEFDDYIASPKNNGYQSLHTAVIGQNGKTLEIQIRTLDMHQQAELGIASHWRYKEGGPYDAHHDANIARLRNILEKREPLFGSSGLAEELLEDRVYIFTPLGDVIDLPEGATVIDFAYQVHTDVGHKCVGAKVNGRIVQLSYILKNGEQVEIITAKEGGPSRDWINPHLKFIATSKARSKIQHWFKQKERDTNIADGKQILHKESKRLGIKDAKVLTLLAKESSCPEQNFLAALGCGDISMAQLCNMLQKTTKSFAVAANPKKITAKKAATDTINVSGIGNLSCGIAKCCRPVPGDPIVGYITIGRGISVHHQDCLNILQATDKNPSRLIEVNWGKS